MISDAKKFTADERREIERQIRQLEHEADMELATDPDGAAMKLAECRLGYASDFAREPLRLRLAE